MKKKSISLSVGLAVFLLLIVNSCNRNKEENRIVIFHAGSLSVPFQEIREAYLIENPDIEVLLEAAGSVDCARKITELNRNCDIMASADVRVIDEFLIPDYASWNLPFARNEMVIAFTEKSRESENISQHNWMQILADEDIIYGRSNPHADPCGYRTVLVLQLEALRSGNSQVVELLKKDNAYIRPKETDLLGLLEAHAIDYIFIYKSVAVQHDLKFIHLSDSINLAKPELNNWYENSTTYIHGNQPGDSVQMIAEAMVYSLTIPKNAENPSLAEDFLAFLLHPEKGMKILENLGQEPIYPDENTLKQLNLND
jgi:molybdate/tungstate transport system substrate-binding protein